MKRLLIIMLSSLSLFAVPAATADGPNPAVTVQNGDTYVYDFTAQVYRLVPDFATGVSLNLNWNAGGWSWVGTAATPDQLGYGGVGQAWPSVWEEPAGFAELADGSLYYYGADGMYHYVPGPDQAFALGATWGDTDWDGVAQFDTPGDLPAPVGDPITT